jgi:hypothetical protein
MSDKPQVEIPAQMSDEDMAAAQAELDAVHAALSSHLPASMSGLVLTSLIYYLMKCYNIDAQDFRLLAGKVYGHLRKDDLLDQFDQIIRAASAPTDRAN